MLEAPTPGRFKTVPAIEEAFALTKRHKRRAIAIVAPFALAFITLELFITPPSLPEGSIAGLLGSQPPLATQLLRMTLSVPIAAAFLLAMGTFGLRRAAGERATFAVITQNLRALPHAIVLAAMTLAPDTLLNALIPGLGGLLALMLGLALMPGIYYVLDQDLDAFRAAWRSLKLALTNLGQALLVTVLTLVGAIAGALSLGFGFLLLVPVGMTLGAAIYKQAEGLHKHHGAEGA